MVQGFKTFQVLLLLLAGMWLFGCGTSPTPTSTPVHLNAVVETPVQVTRVDMQQLAAAQTREPAAPCASSHVAEGAPVTIGAIIPLSSPGALLAGFAMQTALNIGINDLNEKRGINGSPLRLVTYDSTGTAERSALAAERLILLDCAVGIVGLYHSQDAIAAAKVAHRYGIPIIIAEASADEITATHYPEVFRLAPSFSMLAQVPATWLKEVGDFNGDGLLVATIMAENSSGAASLISAIQDNLVSNGIGTDLLTIDLPTSDFTPVIARVVAKAALPDAIFIAMKGEPALQLHAQLLEAGIGPQRSTLIVQNHAGLNSEQFWEKVPNGNGTVVLRMGAWSTTLTPRGQEFAFKYDQYMGRWPESYAFAAYDAVTLLAHALQNSPTLLGRDIIATLEKSNETLTSGSITFPVSSASPLSDQQPPYFWHQWADGQILYLQYTEANQEANAMSVIWPPNHRSTTLQTAISPDTP